MSFLRQFLIYGLSGAASRLAAVLLVPLYTRTLSVTDYGALELLLAIYALIVIFAGMQVESAVARDYYTAQARGELGALRWNALYLAFAGTLIAGSALLVALTCGALPAAFDAPTLGLLLLLTMTTQVFGVQLVVLRFGANALTFALISFCDLALCAAFSVVYIVGLQMGVHGALFGVLSGKLACIALAWRWTYGMSRPIMPRRGQIRPMLEYGVPAIPAVLVNWAQNAGSRVLLAAALTLNDVAIAAIAVKVAAIYGFLIASFRLAWEPFSIAKLESLNEDPDVYNRALEWYVTTMFIACGATSLLAPYVVRLLAPPAYAAAGQLAVFFLFSQFWIGVTNVLVVGIHGARRTGQLLPVYGLGALVNAGALLALAPLIGVASAGLAAVAGSVATALLALHYSNRHLASKFNWRLIVWCLIGTGTFALIDYAVIRERISASGSSPAATNAIAVLALLLLTAVMVTQSIPRSRQRAMLGYLSQLLPRNRP